MAKAWITAAISLILLGMAQDQENPAFAGWKGFKPGSWVRLGYYRERTIKGETVKFGNDRLETLGEISDEKAVLTVKESRTNKGVRTEEASNSKGIEAKKIDEEYRKPLSHGDEEIELTGKKLKCQWTEYGSPGTEAAANAPMLKIWRSKEIPGGVARAALRNQESGSWTTLREALEWKGQ